MQVFDNVVEPIDPRTATVGKYAGDVEVLALEVAVSKIMRWLLKTQQRSVADLAILHGVAVG